MFDFNGGDNGYGVQTAANDANVTNMNPSVNGVLAGNKNPNGANAAALVSTGAITSTAETVFGSELFYVNGPFSIQAEYAALTFIDSVGAGGFRGSTGDLTVSGGYVAVSYLLTGENRTYDTRLGRLGTNYLEVQTPFWLVRDANGLFNAGLGAWELEARFSHLELNTHDINGGATDALNLGVVWHLNNNLRMTFDYLRQNRYDLPNGVNSGWLSGFGIRTQLIF
jgi:phosphate-selective porin